MNKKIILFILLVCLPLSFSSCSSHSSIKEKITFQGFSLNNGDEIRGIYMFNATARSIEDMRLITPPSIGAGNYDWSSDGEWFIFACEEEDEWVGICKIYKNGNNFEIIITEDDFGASMWIYHPLTLSPDGKKFIFGKLTEYDPLESHLYMVDIQTKNITNILSINYYIHNVSWSPDGQYLAYEISTYEIFLLDLNTLESEYLTNGIHPTWSPDGKHIAFSGIVPLYIISLENREEETIVDQDGICVSSHGFSWSSDGGSIVFLNNCGEYDPDMGLYMVNLDTGKITRLHNKWGTRNGPLSDPQWIPELLSNDEE